MSATALHAGLKAAYEDVAYVGSPNHHSHPDRLAAIATLFGMTPADPARARVLEVGCGDGTLLLGVARTLGWRDVQLTLLDREPAVEPKTLAAYADLGWRAHTVVADVFEAAAGASREGHDLVVASLFLHHFEAGALARLCAALAACAPAVVAYEPRRSRLALLGSRLVVFVGANAVTREDAVLSVRAGFRGQELSAAWQAAVGAGWRLDEGTAGPFGHRFCALRAQP
jgi:SAM-dependent methyltransferase